MNMHVRAYGKQYGIECIAADAAVAALQKPVRNRNPTKLVGIRIPGIYKKQRRIPDNLETCQVYTYVYKIYEYME